MEVLKIAAIGIITALVSMFIKDIKPEFSVLTIAAGGVIIIIMIADYLGDIIFSLNGIIDKSGIDDSIVKTVIKIVGIGYVSEFSASVCEDTGANSLAQKILFAGKVIMLFICVPMLESVVKIIYENFT